MTRASAKAALRTALVHCGLTPAVHLWRFARDPRAAKHEADVWRDYLTFRRRYAFLGEGRRPAESAPKVMVVSVSDWVAQVKMEGMLTKVLQLRGYRPVIVTTRHPWRARRYFEVFGYEDFVFFDDLLQAVPDATVAAEAERIFEHASSFRALLETRYRGLHVGRHVLSAVVRSLRNGSVDFTDPQVSAVLRQVIPYAIRAAIAAEGLLERVRPSLALFLDKGYSPHAQIFDAAVNRGVGAIQFVHSHRSDAFIFKRYTPENRTVHPVSLAPESWRSVRAMPWSERRDAEIIEELSGRYEGGTWFSRKYLQIAKRLKSPDAVRAQLGLDPGRKTAVIFSHVVWDATFFFGDNLFDDYEEWLVETVKAACENPNVNWVIKLHPDYVWKMKQLGDGAAPRDVIALGLKVGTLPPHVRVMPPDTDISTWSVFPVTDYCLTVRGTVGTEMPCFGVPVFTAGTGRYSGLGFTVDSTTRAEYLQKVRRIHEFPSLTPEQAVLARKHAYALFKLRPLEVNTFQMIQMPFEKLGHPLDHNVVIRARSLQEIADAADLRAFGDWAAGSSDADFLSATG